MPFSTQEAICREASRHSRPLTRDRLVAYFAQGCKPASEQKVGVEWEKLGVYRDTGRAIAYSGPRGVEAIFTALSVRYGWQPVIASGHIIALKKNTTTITLEPGGQIELSGWKATTLDENASELYSHLDEIEQVSVPLGIAWLGLGAQPLSTADEIEWVPKERYAIMRESLKGRGELTYSMMKETASVQISVDYISERDAAEKLRLALGLSPLLAALFANSPLWRGQAAPYLSRRSQIWLGTDPARTGLIRRAFEPGFGFEAYTDFALEVPLLFLVRGERWQPVHGITFGDFLKHGYDGKCATLADWELHLTSLFTEARLKHYVEIRSIDCQKTDLGLSAVALLKGVFYDPVSRGQAWELVGDLSWEERLRLASEVPARGLKTRWRGATLHQAALQLLQWGEEGLQRLSAHQLALEDESKYLAPLKELIQNRGLTPAEALLQCLNLGADGQSTVENIIRCAALR